MMMGIVAGQARRSAPAQHRTVAHLSFEGANESTVFTDVTGRAWSRNGSGVARIDTSQSAVGSSSLLISGPAWLTTPASADFDFPGDFSIKVRIRPVSVSGIRMIASRQIDSPTGLALQLRIYNSALEAVLRDRAGGQVITISSGAVVGLNEWRAVELVRRSGVVQLLLDGVVAASQACAFNLSAATPRGFVIGSPDGNALGTNYFFDGHIDELLITAA